MCTLREGRVSRDSIDGIALKFFGLRCEFVWQHCTRQRLRRLASNVAVRLLLLGAYCASVAPARARRLHH